jgi:hypothetical protein
VEQRARVLGALPHHVRQRRTRDLRLRLRSRSDRSLVRERLGRRRLLRRWVRSVCFGDRRRGGDRQRRRVPRDERGRPGDREQLMVQQRVRRHRHEHQRLGRGSAGARPADRGQRRPRQRQRRSPDAPRHRPFVRDGDRRERGSGQPRHQQPDRRPVDLRSGSAAHARPEPLAHRRQPGPGQRRAQERPRGPRVGRAVAGRGLFRRERGDDEPTARDRAALPVSRAEALPRRGRGDGADDGGAHSRPRWIRRIAPARRRGDAGGDGGKTQPTRRRRRGLPPPSRSPATPFHSRTGSVLWTRSGPRLDQPSRRSSP